MSTKIMPISELRRKTSEVLDELRDKDKENEVYVTRYGHPVAVLVNYEHYEQLKECSDHGELETTSNEKPVYPTVATPLFSLQALSGLLKDGYEGDALADTEALYDGVEGD